MFPCPHCGEPLADDAVACRECGSDADTGWSDDIDYQSVELPEDPPQERSPWLWLVALTLLMVLLGLMGGLFQLAARNGRLAAFLGLAALIFGVELLYTLGLLKRSFFRRGD